MYVMFLIYGRYFTDGVGYATIQSILRGDMTLAYMMAMLFFAKLFATSVSLAAGASGGVFSPSLFLGATLGGCFGAVLSTIWPHLGFGPVQFAIIGMAAIVGGGTGAAMTAILMIFEMTGDYTTIVPVILAVASAIGTRRFIMDDNIYTMKLTRRGQHIPKERHSHMFTIRKADDVMAPITKTVRLGDLRGRVRRSKDTDIWVIGDHYAAVETGRGRFIGVVPVEENGDLVEGATLIDRFTVIRSGAFLQDVMRRMARRKAIVAIVLKEKGVPRPDRIAGVVHRENIADAIIGEYAE
jgi:CIC family chloride channel protein